MRSILPGASRGARILAVSAATLAAGCAPPGAVNERNVVESTPTSTVAPYAETPDAHHQHMVERMKGMSQGGRESYRGQQ
ncbi:hypothetical protein [Tautonia plasticadhaerens]|uniref:Lipoprotein n=1 Tax=Tautonia plasticadhaerens TaxID=2527974 RepID=A0A518HEU8_9BACT|nr:hypothetical protein [Tautonia plasticadhaerens]QDV39364.1 hypothetical protein ElP_73300 [Tautonia plasticadhaerens]